MLRVTDAAGGVLTAAAIEPADGAESMGAGWATAALIRGAETCDPLSIAWRAGDAEAAGTAWLTGALNPTALVLADEAEFATEPCGWRRNSGAAETAFAPGGSSEMILRIDARISSMLGPESFSALDIINPSTRLP